MIKSYEDIVKFSKDNMDAVIVAGTTFAKGYEEISKECVSYAGKSFDTAVEASKALATCKTPAEFSELQTKLTKESFDGAVAQSKKLGEMTSVVLKSAFEPVGARVKTVFETAVPKAA